MEQLTLFEDMKQPKNKNQLIINDEGKQCLSCEEFKLYDGFYFDKRNNRYTSRCKECCRLAQRERDLEKKNCPERRNLFNSIERKYVQGERRADGRLFWGYSISASPKKNFEVWLKEDSFDNSIEKRDNWCLKRKDQYLNKEKKYKRGYVRDDGMIFWEYCQRHASNDFEKWVSKDDFNKMRFDDTMGCNLRSNLGKFGGKDELREDIFGLNKKDFDDYIESLFEEGMTWDNWGTWVGKWDPENPRWHVDHIIPLSSVDNIEDTKLLWHYTNLRPMWGNQNLSKGKKYCKKERDSFLEERRSAK